MAATARSIFVSGRVIISKGASSGLDISYSPTSAPNGTTVTLTITGASPGVPVSQIQVYSPGSVTSVEEVLGNTDGSGNFSYAGLVSWGPGFTSVAMQVYINGIYQITISLTNPSPLPADNYWISAINGDRTRNFGVTTDFINNIYSAGDTRIGFSGINDAYISKYNSAGTLQWQRQLGNTISSPARAITIDSMDNVYAVGNLSTPTQTATFIIKYNDSGVLQWQKYLYISEDALTSTASGLTIDTSNNLYILGTTQNIISPWDTRFLIAKYNSSGTLQWQRALLGCGESKQIIVKSSNIYITGSADGFTGAIAKYNDSGVFQWERIIDDGGGSFNMLSDVAVDSANDVITVGSSSVSLEKAVIVKYNSSGTTQWQRTLENTYGCRYVGVVTDSSDNIYTVGESNDTEFASIISIIIAKYNSSGTLQWQRTFTNGDVMNVTDLTINPAGNICISGYASPMAEAPPEAFILKLPTDGSLTGTYGSYIYSSSSFTSATSSLNITTPSFTSETSTLTSAVMSLSESTPSFTRTITPI